MLVSHLNQLNQLWLPQLAKLIPLLLLVKLILLPVVLPKLVTLLEVSLPLPLLALSLPATFLLLHLHSPVLVVSALVEQFQTTPLLQEPHLPVHQECRPVPLVY